MSDKQKRELAAEWDRLHNELEKAQNADRVAIAASYENSIARIETQLGDVDPRDWL